MTSNRIKEFEHFLKYIANSTDFEKYKKLQLSETKRLKLLGISLEELIVEAIVFMKTCSLKSKSGYTWDMSLAAKDGFDVLLKYAPQKIKDVIQSGGKPLLNQFSNKESKVITSQSIAYVNELSTAMVSCSMALASELDKYEMTTNSPEDVSSRYWLMNFLDPLNKKELKSIVDAFFVPLLDEEQAKKIVKFLLVRFPSYYKEFTEEEKVEPAPEPEKVPVPEFVKEELEKTKTTEDKPEEKEEKEDE